MSLRSFVRGIQEQPIKSKLGAHDILAPEFFVTQGLRFTFDVRHPMTGLGAGWMELLAMARGEAGMSVRTGDTKMEVLNGDGASKAANEQQKKAREDTAKSLQQSFLSLPQTPTWTNTTGKQTPSDPPARTLQALERRVGLAHDRAKELLSEAALISDAYFLYSPSQIWLAALWIADEPLARCYLGTKIPLPASVPVTQNGEEKSRETRGGSGNAVENEKEQHIATRILSTIISCAAVLAAQHHGPEARTSKEELVRIDKKLYKCRNPDKRDLVGLNRAVKSGQHGAAAKEGVGGGGHADAGANGDATASQHVKREAGDDPDQADDYTLRDDRSPAKKRRVDVGKTMSADDVFGGPLKPP